MATRVEIEYAQKGSGSVVSAANAQTAAIEKITKELRSHQTTSNKYTAELRRRRDAQQAETKAQRDAAKVLQAIQTPQQKYLEQVKTLKRHHEAGRITLKNLQQGTTQYQAELQKATGTTERRAVAERQRIAAQVDAEKKRIALQRESNALVSASRTPQQRYNEQVAHANKLEKQGHLTKTQLKQVTAGYLTELKKATGVTERQAAAEKKRIAAQVDAEKKRIALQREANTLVSASLTPQQRYNEQVARANQLEQQGHLTKTQLKQVTAGYSAELKKATQAQDRNNAELQESKRIIERNRSPLEKYRAEHTRLKTHLDRGRISQREFKLEVARAKREMVSAKRAARELGSSRFGKMAGSVRGVAAGIFAGAGVLAGLRFWINANSKILKQADQLKTKFDTVATRFAVQSGISELEEESATRKILDVAETRRVPVEQVADAATQLVSSGFSVDEVLQGGGLNEFIRGLNASNAVAKDDEQIDSKELAKAVGQYLASQGLEKNTANLKEITRNVQALFKTTDVQLADLGALAKVSSGFRDVLTQQEQLAVFSVLRETEGGASEAAVLQRNIIGRSRTARSSKTKIAALESLGLKPDDVDLIGESVVDVLERYGDAIRATQKTSPETVAPAIKQLFEEKAVAGVLNLAADRNGVRTTDLIRQRVLSLSDTSGFKEDAARQERSRKAILINQEIRQHRAVVKYSKDLDLIKNEMTIFLTERRTAPTTITASEVALEQQIALGLNQRESLTRALKLSGYGAADAEIIVERLKITQRKKGYRDAIDQAPGVGAISAEDRERVQVQKERGFNPEARVSRARSAFNAALDSVGKSVPSSNSVQFGSGSWGPTIDLVNSRDQFMANKRWQFDRAIALKASKLPAGEIEKQTAAMLDRLRTSIGPEDSQVNREARRAVTGSLEDLKKFEALAREKAKSRAVAVAVEKPIPPVADKPIPSKSVSNLQPNPESPNDETQAAQLDTLNEIRDMQRDQETLPSPSAPSPRRTKARAAALSKESR